MVYRSGFKYYFLLCLTLPHNPVRWAMNTEYSQSPYRQVSPVGSHLGSYSGLTRPGPSPTREPQRELHFQETACTEPVTSDLNIHLCVWKTKVDLLCLFQVLLPHKLKLDVFSSLGLMPYGQMWSVVRTIDLGEPILNFGPELLQMCPV